MSEDTKSGRTEVIQHLQMIQAVISRMSDNSFSVKRWSVTLILGVLVTVRLGVAPDHWGGKFLVIVPFIYFWGLDAYYLWQERGYRNLYDCISKKSETTFSMKSENANNRYWRAVFSITLCTLHLTVCGILFIAVCYQGN